jgi:hypothetical protein
VLKGVISGVPETVCCRLATIGVRSESTVCQGRLAVAGQEQELNAARFVVAGEGGGGASGGGSAGGGFTLDRDAMTTELGNLKKLQDRIADQLRAAVPMWSIQSPGNDPASQRNTAACNNSGLAYQNALVRQRDFVGVFIGKIEKALGIHESSDEQAAHTVNTQSDGGHF